MTPTAVAAAQYQRVEESRIFPLMSGNPAAGGAINLSSYHHHQHHHMIQNFRPVAYDARSVSVPSYPYSSEKVESGRLAVDYVNSPISQTMSPQQQYSNNNNNNNVTAVVDTVIRNEQKSFHHSFMYNSDESLHSSSLKSPDSPSSSSFTSVSQHSTKQMSSRKKQLERNRLAAAKCRSRKKAEFDELRHLVLKQSQEIKVLENEKDSLVQKLDEAIKLLTKSGIQIPSSLASSSSKEMMEMEKDDKQKSIEPIPLQKGQSSSSSSSSSSLLLSTDSNGEKLAAKMAFFVPYQGDSLSMSHVISTMKSSDHPQHRLGLKPVGPSVTHKVNESDRARLYGATAVSQQQTQLPQPFLNKNNEISSSLSNVENFGGRQFTLSYPMQPPYPIEGGTSSSSSASCSSCNSDGVSSDFCRHSQVAEESEQVPIHIMSIQNLLQAASTLSSSSS